MISEHSLSNGKSFYFTTRDKVGHTHTHTIGSPIRHIRRLSSVISSSGL